MRTSENRDLLAKNAIPDELREPMNNGSPNISIQSWINLRVFGEYSKDFGNLRMEVSAETGSLRLVPDLRLSKIEFCGTPYLDLEAQRSSRSSRVFTSGQGLWSSGWDSMSANRASSNALSASVTGRSLGESESQTAPISSKRSAGFRLTILAMSDSSIMGPRIAQRAF